MRDGFRIKILSADVLADDRQKKDIVTHCITSSPEKALFVAGVFVGTSASV